MRGAERFWLLSRGYTYPQCLEDILSYIAALADGERRTKVSDFMATLTFIERSCGTPVAEAFSARPEVRAAAEEAKLQGSGGEARQRREARRFPVVFLAALEEITVDEEARRYVRLAAWLKAVQIWAALRFDDHRGLAPESLLMGVPGLTGALTRTKTSGAGKKREVLNIFVSPEAYVRCASWLQVGWKLWDDLPKNRDFFLGVPTADLSGMRLVEAKYSDGVAITRALLAAAVSPAGGGLVVVPELFVAWSEHSPRACMPSGAGCFSEFPKDWVDMLGRWQAGQSADYVRTARKRVMQMQGTEARAIRGGEDPADILDELGLFEDLDRFMRAAGVPAHLVDEQLEKLKFRATVLKPGPATPATVPYSPSEDQVHEASRWTWTRRARSRTLVQAIPLRRCRRSRATASTKKYFR